MQKKVLIICVGGMSSSMVARKASEQLNNNGFDVYVDACDVASSHRLIKERKFDLYLVSPQIRMVSNTLTPIANAAEVCLVDIPNEDYVPVGPGLKRLLRLIINHLDFSKNQ